MQAMTAHPSDPSPRPLTLTALQAATLQEIGISRHFLADYLPQAAKAESPDQRTPNSRAVAVPALAEKVIANTPAAPQNLANLANEILQSARQQPRQSRQAPAAVDAANFPPCEFVLPEWAAKVLEQSNGAFEVMVVSEAPGLHDDTHAHTSPDRMGVLLQAMLKAAGITPQTSVFYTHLLHVRPLVKQGATAQELATGLAALRQQIARLRPRRILALGQLAAQILLGKQPDSEALESLRGRTHTYVQDDLSIPLIATYAPSVLLARPRYKALAWQDLTLLELPGRAKSTTTLAAMPSPRPR